MTESSTQSLEAIQILGGSLGVIILASGIISWILVIMLLFKIWGMTNNVEKIKQSLDEWLNIEHPVITDDGKGASGEKP